MTNYNVLLESGNETLVEVGESYNIADITDAGNIEEVIESNSVWLGDDEGDMSIIADFKILQENTENPWLTKVEITEIY